MTTSKSKGRFFYKTNRFELFESIRIANWNALVAMACTVADWSNEDTFRTFRTTSCIGGGESATEASSSTPASFLLPYKIALLLFGLLGTLTNGFVLGGFWFADRSKMTSSSVHIVNHTTLERSNRRFLSREISRQPFSRPTSTHIIISTGEDAFLDFVAV